MTSQNGNSVNALFQNAVGDQVLSTAALNAINIQDIGDEINNALGVSVDDVKASEVVLMTQLIDDSGSIRFSRNEEHVRDGHNLILDSLAKTKQKEGILVMCSYLNGTLLYPYMPVDKAVRMDTKNFAGTGSTPLYDEAIATLAKVIAKTQDFLDNGISCRTVTAIVTDGADSGSRKQARDVKKVVADMLRAENHIIAGIGIDDGSTDFKTVFNEMGIPDEWILTPGNNASEIRKAFNMLSQSSVRASQGAAVFSATAMGGFASP